MLHVQILTRAPPFPPLLSLGARHSQAVEGYMPVARPGAPSVHHLQRVYVYIINTTTTTVCVCVCVCVCVQREAYERNVVLPARVATSTQPIFWGSLTESVCVRVELAVAPEQVHTE